MRMLEVFWMILRLSFDREVLAEWEDERRQIEWEAKNERQINE